MKLQFLSALVAVIGVDQGSKYLATQAELAHLNRGISFGFIATTNQVFLVLLSVSILVGLWCWQASFWQRYPLIAGLLFGGGASNILDRLWVGGVRDWLLIPGLNIANNLADWAIAVAVTAILLLELREQRQRADKETNEN